MDLRHIDEVEGSNVVDIGMDLSEFYMSVEWDILEVPAVRYVMFFLLLPPQRKKKTFGCSLNLFHNARPSLFFPPYVFSVEYTTFWPGLTRRIQFSLHSSIRPSIVVPARLSKGLWEEISSALGSAVT